MKNTQQPMTITFPSWVKAIVYLTATAGLTVAAAVFENGMYDDWTAVSSCLSAMWYLFAAGCITMGVGVYSYRSYTKTHREHRADSLLWTLTGLVTVIAFIVLFLGYGGLDAMLDSTAYAVRNALSMLVSALPLPFLVRGWVISAARRTRFRRALTAAVAVEAVALVVLAVLGLYIKIVPYSI